MTEVWPTSSHRAGWYKALTRKRESSQKQLTLTPAGRASTLTLNTLLKTAIGQYAHDLALEPGLF